MKKKIEKIKKLQNELYNLPDYECSANEFVIINKINEIIDYLNKKEKTKKECEHKKVEEINFPCSCGYEEGLCSQCGAEVWRHDGITNKWREV